VSRTIPAISDPTTRVIPTPAAAGGPVATPVDLSAGAILLDPGSYISSRSASAVVTNTNGSSSSINVVNMAMIDLGGDTSDGVYTWDLTRTDPGSLDKMGLLLGFFDSASTSRNILGGIFETVSVREINTGIGSSLVSATNNNLTRVVVSVRLGTDESSKRIIGPGWLEAYNGSSLIDVKSMEEVHVITGTLRKACGVRRGTAGAPVGDFGYTLTELKH
jgi:hypothetical protein